MMAELQAELAVARAQLATTERALAELRGQLATEQVALANAHQRADDTNRNMERMIALHVTLGQQMAEYLRVRDVLRAFLGIGTDHQ